jgi:hypothetical protein
MNATADETALGWCALNWQLALLVAAAALLALMVSPVTCCIARNRGFRFRASQLDAIAESLFLDQLAQLTHQGSLLFCSKVLTLQIISRSPGLGPARLRYRHENCPSDGAHAHKNSDFMGSNNRCGFHWQRTYRSHPHFSQGFVDCGDGR